jgi:hypothetical protein
MLHVALMLIFTGFPTESLPFHLQYMLQTFKQTTRDINGNALIILTLCGFDAMARIVLM